MERLLAYEGPVVHVDHGHRAPAPTSFSTREVAEERKECNRHLQKVHDDHEANTAWEKNRIVELQQALLDKDKQLQEERRHKETAQRKHEWAVKEMAKEEADRVKAKEDCDHAVAALHNNYTRAAKGDADEIVKLQRELKAQEEELARARFLITEMQASELSRSKVINEYYEELAEDNKNYMKMIRGVDQSALPRFLAVHAMTHTKATRPPVDQEAREYILWIQKKLATQFVMDEAAAKGAVGKGEWVV